MCIDGFCFIKMPAQSAMNTVPLHSDLPAITITLVLGHTEVTVLELD